MSDDLKMRTEQIGNIVEKGLEYFQCISSMHVRGINGTRKEFETLVCDLAAKIEAEKNGEK